MTLVRFLLTATGVVAAAVLILFVSFVYETFSVKTRDVKADGIVVLAGGLGRVDEGIRLYRARKGEVLLFIGTDPSVRKKDLLKERPGDDIVLENVSRNTYENALYSRPLVERRNMRSLILITSRYHMKRATLIFRNVLPKDLAIYPHPVDSKNLKEQWWSHRGSFRLLFGEFYKYWLFRLFFALASTDLRPLVNPQ